MIHKLLKKISNFFGYKLIEKNLIKNQRSISNKSFLKIEKLLDKLFENEKIILIQIGANDGKRFDLLNFYIKKYKCKSLLVEPIKENFEQLKANYKGHDFIIFENSAISTNDEIQKLYKVASKYIKEYSDHIPGITSFNKKHLIKHGVKNKHITTENVSSIKISQLIKKYSFDSFQLLYVDAEGYDGNIVIDFLLSTRIRPIIMLEYIHIANATLTILINLLEKNNYIFFTINENLICYPSSYKKLIQFN